MQQADVRWLAQRGMVFLFGLTRSRRLLPAPALLFTIKSLLPPFFSFLFFISIYSCSSHYFPPLSILIPPSLPDINLPLLEFHTLKGRSNFLSDSALLVFLRHCCLLIHSIADLCVVSTLKIIFRAFFWCGRYISERKRAPEMLHMVSVEKYKTCIWTQNTTASLSLHYFLHCPQESLNFYCNLDVLTAAHTQLYTQTHSSQFVPD